MNLKTDIEQYAKDTLDGELAAGIDHFERVYSNAKKIAKKGEMNYDDQILHAACFLHDIEQDEPHAEKSSHVAEKFLKKINFPEEKIAPVKKAILTHLPNGQPTTDEGILLHDADLLDFLGAIGITRLSIAAWDWFNAKDMREVVKTLKKYRKVYSSLILDESKKLANNKIIVMDMFIRQLEDEMKI
ncbi:MAG: HD domain-containing protein [Nanohaloarchaea archaeon]|nr:HD domain-containing protein [Candidatus Nanohaloarchaea archaeon]